MAQPIFSQYTPITVANTTAETTLTGTGKGALSIAANSVAQGTVFQFRASGYLSVVSSPTFELKVKIGGVVVCDTGVATASLTFNNNLWSLEADVVVNTIGNAGTMTGQGLVKAIQTITANRMYQMTNSGSPSAIDTTAANAIDLTVTWGTASANDTITCTNFTVVKLP